MFKDLLTKAMIGRKMKVRICFLETLFPLIHNIFDIS